MKFRRILLKLSGESLAGENKQGINVERLSEYAQQIREIADMGVQIGIVIGGGISNEPMFIDLAKEAIEEKFKSAIFPGITMPEIMACRYQSDANLVGAVYNFMEIMEGAGY